MNVALIFPNYLESFRFTPVSSHQNLGLAMIAAVARKAGHHVQIIDATAEKLNLSRLYSRLKGFDPDVIGITANVAFGWKALLTGKWLRNRFPKVVMVFGGPWATAEYKWLLEAGAANVVVLSEGETTFVDLLQSIEAKNDFSNIKGIAYCNGTQIHIAEKRDYIEELDSLPFPAWDLFPSPRKYMLDSKGARFFPIMTSRGCPYSCVNCTKLVHGLGIRTRSIKNVLDEIRYLRTQYHADEIIIIDDNFNQDVARAGEILDGIRSIGFNLHLRFSNGLRADKIPPSLAVKLKAAGAYQIALGIESGDQGIIDRLGKKLRLDDVGRTIGILHRVGIMTIGFFMVGLPWDTLHTLVKTKRFIIQSKLDRAYAFKVLPIPGTELYGLLKEKSVHFDEFPRHMLFYSYDYPMFEIDGLSNEHVIQALQDINREFYLKPSKILGQLRHLNAYNWRFFLSAFILTILRIFGY